MADPAGVAQYLQQFPVPRDDLGLPSTRSCRRPCRAAATPPPAGAARSLHAVVEQRIPDIGDGGRGIAGHVDPGRPGAQRGRRAAGHRPARGHQAWTRFARMGRPIRPSPTSPISASPHRLSRPAAGRSCRRTRKVQPGSFGTFMIPNGRGVRVPAAAAGWPGHGAPSRIWMLPGSKASSELRPGPVRPVVAHGTLGGPVLGGVQGPETLVETGGVQRGPQARSDHAGGGGLAGEQQFQPLHALDTADRRGVGLPFHLALMIGDHGQVGDPAGRSGARYTVAHCPAASSAVTL